MWICYHVFSQLQFQLMNLKSFAIFNFLSTFCIFETNILIMRSINSSIFMPKLISYFCIEFTNILLHQTCACTREKKIEKKRETKHFQLKAISVCQCLFIYSMRLRMDWIEIVSNFQLMQMQLIEYSLFIDLCSFSFRINEIFAWCTQPIAKR